jgi:FeS assembly protein SufB
MAASASTSLFAPCALTAAKLGAAARPSRRGRVDARRGRLSVVAVQTGPQKPSPSPSSPAATDEAEALQNLLKREYKYGFVSDFESFSIPKGLSEATVRRISELKSEPSWMLDFRLAAYRRFLTMAEPTWSDNVYAPVDLQSLCFYSAPKAKPKLNSLDEVDPELLRTFDRLGIPLGEQKRLSNVAVDAVIDSTSIATTHREALMAKGVIFCSISEAVREYPDLVRRYLGSIVPPGDNYYAALNSAVFSDGSFCYIPKDTVCPMEISTYFRINDKETGQFERTLIVADERSTVSYLEGCTAPAYDTNQLHAAVVELVCEEGAEIKYSTVQNWYAGDEEGKGGIYNFVTKRGRCKGRGSKISWTQVETGSAITWKYPSVELVGDDTVGEFYSVALTKDCQQADTGTKMIHKGKNSRSRIISKGISAGKSRNCYRGLVQMNSGAENAYNSSQCDSLLIGDNAAANTYPTIQVNFCSSFCFLFTQYIPRQKICLRKTGFKELRKGCLRVPFSMVWQASNQQYLGLSLCVPQRSSIGQAVAFVPLLNLWIVIVLAVAVKHIYV